MKKIKHKKKLPNSLKYFIIFLTFVSISIMGFHNDIIDLYSNPNANFQLVIIFLLGLILKYFPILLSVYSSYKCSMWSLDLGNRKSAVFLAAFIGFAFNIIGLILFYTYYIGRKALKEK